MLTAKDLLYKALDYDGFWNTSKRMKDSKPSACRKAQLNKLLDGFEITRKNARANSLVSVEVNGNSTMHTVYATSRNPISMGRIEYVKTLTSLQYFTQGEFIADTDRAKYNDLIGQIISTAKIIFPAQSKLIDKEPVNLVRLFSEVYNFRHTLYLLLKHISTAKTNERFFIDDDYSLHLKKEFLKSTNDNLSEVDELLCTLIDPAKRQLNEDKIAYPTFDLESIDEEWRNGFFK